MRIHALAIFLLMGTPIFSQEPKHLSVPIPGAAKPVSITATEIVRDGPYPGLVHAKGSVEIKTAVCLSTAPNGSPVCDGYTLVYADEATLNENTGEIEARGTVKITPLFHER